MATMLDFSMAFLLIAFTPDGKAAATANLNLLYPRPALPGAYTAQARIERLGRTLGFAHAVLRPQDGDPVATATGTFSVFDATHPGPAR